MTVTTVDRMGTTAALGGVRVGDRVRVRSRQEILATLDERGRLDGLPFMPEMLAAVGRVFEVDAVVNRTCDTVKTDGTSGTTRGMDRVVHLRGSRCDGSVHGGCQARCLLYWKLDWLEPAPGAPLDAASATAPGEVVVELRARVGDDVPATLTMATHGPGHTDDDPVWSCQATELLSATRFVSARKVRPWLDDIRAGNATARQALVSAGVIALNKWQGLSRRLPRLLRFHDGRSWPAVHPSGEGLRPPSTGLRPGEIVEVRALREIEATLNDKSEQRGLRFSAEMIPYCGTQARVLARVDRIIDEKSGRMLSLRDCIMLEGVWCTGDHRVMCRRKIYSYWREAWLQRVGDAPAATDQPARVAAVVVTYNRREALRSALVGILAQSRPVNEVIVVDNASTDGTAAMVEADFPSVRLVRMDDNTGAAGGMAEGLRAGVAAGHDWVWLFDDDDIPDRTALEALLDAVDDLPQGTGVVGCARVGDGGRPLRLGLRWRRGHPVASPTVSLAASSIESPEVPPIADHAPGHVAPPVPLDVVSLSCTLVSVPLVQAIGLPRPGYFVMFEDTEYVLRARRAGWQVYALPTVLATSRNMGSADRSPPWRGYYQTRNQLAMALEHRSPREVGWWAVRTAKLSVGAVLGGDRPAERIRLRVLGAWHGLRGIDGRVIEPGGVADDGGGVADWVTDWEADWEASRLAVVPDGAGAFASASSAGAPRGRRPRVDWPTGRGYSRVGSTGGPGGDARHTGRHTEQAE
jgi:GT2 family glycosyltransferase